MELLPFVPENTLEELILRARRGSLPMDDLLQKIAEAPVFISSRSEVQDDGTGFEPLLVGKEDRPLVAVFSTISRAEMHRDRASYVLRMRGDEFFRRLPTGFGVVLNPGFQTQLVISEDVVLQLRKR